MVEKFLLNKRAGEKYISIWWFAILLIIAVFIAIGVAANSAADYSIKQIEAEVMRDKVIGCLIENGYLIDDILNETFDILKECNINKKIVDVKDGEQGRYFLLVEVFDFDSCKLEDAGIKCENSLTLKDGKEIYEFGVGSFKTDCKLEGSNRPKCAEDYTPVANKKGQKFFLHVFAGSNQAGRKVIGV